MKKRSMPLTAFLIGPIIAVALSLTVCSGVPERADVDDFKLQFATQYATLQYVEAPNGSIDHEKASRVYDHALAIESHVEKNTSVTVGALEAHLVNQIDWQSLQPDESTAARILISYLSRELRERVDRQSTAADGAATDTKIMVGLFVDTIKNTLEPYRR